MHRFEQWWLAQRLGTRWLLVSAALVISMQLFVIVLIQVVISQQVEARLQQELETGQKVFQSLLDRETARLHDGALSLASSHDFRTAFARNDIHAMEAALNREGERIGAHITALLDADLQLRMTNPLDDLFLVWLQKSAYPDLSMFLPPHARTPAGQVDEASGLAALFQQIAEVATQDRSQTVLALVGNAPFQFAVAPVVDESTNRVRGWVMMAFPIQIELARKLQGILDIQMGLLAGPTGQPMQRVFDTLASGVQWPDLASQAAETWIDADRHLVSQKSLNAMGGVVQIIFLRSHAAVMAPFHRLQLWLALISLGGLGLFVWASMRSVKRITAPLQNLLTATQALQEGNFNTPLLLTTGQDEVARLGRGFDAMRHSLVDQQAEIRRLAYLDRLTGLPNRQRFVESLETALHQAREAEPIAVLCVNLDRFKHVNEVLGYAFGDELLRAVADRLRELGGAGNRLCRLGSDEFGILLNQVNQEQAEATARHILSRLSDGVKLNGQRVDIRASIGIAFGPLQGDKADLLVTRAEMAMRWAKRRLAGVLCFADAYDTSRSDTLTLLGDLRHGLDRGEMMVYLQPKVCLSASDHALSAEALVRWRHPRRGLVPPGEFIPFAEQTGFIGELTQWLLDAVAQHCAAARQSGRPCHVAVNVSTRDLLDERFPQLVQAVLESHGLPAHDLSLEITESAIMDDPQRAAATLKALAELGVALAIDDFGTGYSSLAYLKRLPVQALKIDQSFVRDMSQQENDAIIVRSTIDLAHSLGLEVVAEGVEDEATLQRLREWGCDWAQGFHIARPMSIPDFAVWATNRKVKD